ncbi:unnamed protein product [Cyprideis torosa]|uniref:Uncharacterized protein n=1 Tax=Cyprideis torosa TaxID=163714 RepID=A0A7R8ZRY0_9CRUS|nr:unnamed protein product [Cyprideis torosa]CAG0895020.1 unnamed protein product [Cyprideis torosa]
MADQDVLSKQEIQAVFKKLRAVQSNKVCFDCSAKNPTWASVTYGVFICIDCSATHRSLGVHLTFVRSTQLDTNWTWLQIRNMQLGGNANARTFFSQHNCTTTDAQMKYNSRAAQLYREKLHNMAVQAQRVYGNKLFIDTGHHEDHPHSPKEEGKDFFAEHTEALDQSAALSTPTSNGSSLRGLKVDMELPKEGPSVEAALGSPKAPVQQPIKSSIIGAKKPAVKKSTGALGGKKAGGGMGGGLGQRVKTDFSQLEREAEQVEKRKVEEELMMKEARDKEREDAVKRLASMKLAYEDLGAEKQKEEAMLRNTDPKKADQLERLGMGRVGGVGSKGGHSVVSDIVTIEQEGASEPPVSKKKSSGRSMFDDEDDFETLGFGFAAGGRWKDVDADTAPTSSFFEDELGGGSKATSNKPSWMKDMEERAFREREPIKEPLPQSSFSSSASKGAGAYKPPATEEAVKKFANAKAISSDQFFGSQDNEWERKQNVSRFEGQSAISSDMYFNRSPAQAGRGGYGVGTPDLEDVKDSVKAGVSKVAGRLSTIASDVMSSLQDKYGGY